jgi:parallel beta-helix repeat protein
MNRVVPLCKRMMLIGGILVFLILLSGGNGSGKTITVDDDGEADHSTIQDAIDASQDGDAIKVFDGTYDETVIVDKSLSIIGNGSEVTQINGGGNGDVVTITAPWVNFSGVIISESGNKDAGIRVESEHNRIENVTCSNHDYGIYLFNCGNTTIENTNCTSNKYEGILLSSSNNCTIRNTNCYSNRNIGIHLRESNNITIENNHCSSDRGTGIRIYRSNNITIEKNTCIMEGGSGIYLSSASNCTIQNNNCSTNNNFGISLRESNDITIEDNDCTSKNNTIIYLSRSISCTVRNNRNNGISLQDSNDITIEDNLCDSVGTITIRLTRSSKCTFENNTLEKSGFFISGTRENWDSHIIRDSNTVHGNPVHYLKNVVGAVFPEDFGQVILANCSWIDVKDQNFGTIAYELLIGYSSNITIENTTCSNIVGDGITIEGSSFCTITNLTCSGNIGNGFSLQGSSFCTISNTVCFNNTVDGISISNSRYCTIMNTTCSNNTGNGISLKDSNNCTITNTDCWNNTEDGIYVQYSENCDFRNNSCSLNDHGINLDGSDGCMVTNNSCFSNNHGFNLDGSGDCRFLNNTAYWNMHNGITVINSARCDLWNNTCVSNNRTGIYLGRGGSHHLDTNTCTLNNDHGIHMEDSDNCWLANNTCVSNDLDGIYLENSVNCFLEYNTCSSNEHYGINAFRSDLNDMERNLCESNSHYGIRLTTSPDCNLRYNTCIFNEKDGIYLSGSSDCELESNICSSNNEYGVHLSSANWCELRNNICTSNIINGFYIFFSSNCTIERNTLSENGCGIFLETASRDDTAHNNHIFNNTEYGINAEENNGFDINATNNWWGDSSGPFHPEKNNEGVGDTVTDHVTFDPWIDMTPNSPPTAHIDEISPDPALLGESINFIGHGEDEDGLIERYVWSANGENFYNGTESHISFSELAQGHQTISLKVRDDDGAWSEEVSQSLLIHTKPLARINSISPSPGNTSDTIHFNGEGIDDGTIEGYVWTLNGTELFNGTEPNFDHANFSIGTHTISLKVLDNNGVWSEEVERSFSISEVVEPTPIISISITILSHQDGETVNGTILIEGNASVTNGTLTSVRISINNGSWESVTGLEEWSFSWNSSTVSNGTIPITIRAMDATGSEETLGIHLFVRNENGEEENVPDEEEGDEALDPVVIISIGLLIIIGIVGRYLIRKKAGKRK